MEYICDEIYHIYNRGNNKQQVFFESENYRFFLERLRFYFDEAHIELLAYCLMPNHFHLLVRHRKEGNFSNVMKSFTTSYAMAINKRYGRVGHLFQGRFRPRLVEDEEYLLHLCRYIHLNPLAAKIVAKPEGWDYSDYRLWISSESSNNLPSTVLRNELFGNAAEYQKFVMDYAEAQKREEEIEKYILKPR